MPATFPPASSSIRTSSPTFAPGGVRAPTLIEPSAIANALRLSHSRTQASRRMVIVDQAIAWIRTPMNWNNYAGDAAPTLLSNSGLLNGRDLMITRNNQSYRLSTRSNAAPIHLQHDHAMTHYDVIAGPDGLHQQVRPVRGDGDCLYRAALAGAHQVDPEQITDQQVAELRNQLANHLDLNRARYAESIENHMVAHPPEDGVHPADAPATAGATAIDVLPREILSSIISHALEKAGDLERAEAVSTKFLAASGPLWKTLLKADKASAATNAGISYKEWYQANPADRLSPFVPPKTWLALDLRLRARAQELAGNQVLAALPARTLPASLLRLVHDGRLPFDQAVQWLRHAAVAGPLNRHDMLFQDPVTDALEKRQLPLASLTQWLDDTTLTVAHLHNVLNPPMMTLLQAGLPATQLETWMRKPEATHDNIFSNLSRILSSSGFDARVSRLLVSAQRKNPELLDDLLSRPPLSQETWHKILPYLGILSGTPLVQALQPQDENKWHRRLEYTRLICKLPPLLKAGQGNEIAPGNRILVLQLLEKGITFECASAWLNDPKIARRRLDTLAQEPGRINPDSWLQLPKLTEYLRDPQIDHDILGMLPQLSHQPLIAEHVDSLLRHGAERLAATFGISARPEARAVQFNRTSSATSRALEKGTLNPHKLEKWLIQGGISLERLKAILPYAEKLDQQSLNTCMISSDLDPRQLAQVLTQAQHWLHHDHPEKDILIKRISRVAQWQRNPILQNFGADLVVLLSHGKNNEVQQLEEMTRDKSVIWRDAWRSDVLVHLFAAGNAVQAVCGGTVTLAQLLKLCLAAPPLLATAKDVQHLSQRILPAATAGKIHFEAVVGWMQRICITQPPDMRRRSLMFGLADVVPLDTLSDWMQDQNIPTKTWQAALDENTAVRAALQEGWLRPEQLHKLLRRPTKNIRSTDDLYNLLQQPLIAVKEGSLPLETLAAWCQNNKLGPRTAALERITVDGHSGAMRKALLQALVEEQAQRPPRINVDQRQLDYLARRRHAQTQLEHMRQRMAPPVMPPSPHSTQYMPSPVVQALQDMHDEVRQTLLAATPATRPALTAYQACILELQQGVMAGRLEAGALEPILNQAAQQLNQAILAAQPPASSALRGLAQTRRDLTQDPGSPLSKRPRVASTSS